MLGSWLMMGEFPRPGLYGNTPVNIPPTFSVKKASLELIARARLASTRSRKC